MQKNKCNFDDLKDLLSESKSLLIEKDKKKVDKAGYATPRGGDKGGYQNHVYRHGKVIIPYEMIDDSLDLSIYEDGWVIRLFPEQFFSKNEPKSFKLIPEITLGENAFLLYRSYEDLANFPLEEAWTPREHLDKDGKKSKIRTREGKDIGHYILRVSSKGGSAKVTHSKQKEGIAQGIFAPEYSNQYTNIACQLVLAYLMFKAEDNPYRDTDIGEVVAKISRAGVFDPAYLEYLNITRNGKTCCPLCLKIIKHNEFHNTASFSESETHVNAVSQNISTTRSTAVNLFHMHPLVYGEINNTPDKVSWGHHHCNSNLAQRRCYSLEELKEIGISTSLNVNGINKKILFSPELNFARFDDGSVLASI